MQAELLRELLTEVRAGTRTVESAVERLRNLPYEDIGFARLDHHRALRKGFPEVVFCEGKRVEHVVEIMQRLEQKHSPVLATRASREVYDAVAARLPAAKYFEDARMIQLGVNGNQPTRTSVLIVCAGTADVANEDAPQSFTTALEKWDARLDLSTMWALPAFTDYSRPRIS